MQKQNNRRIYLVSIVVFILTAVLMVSAYRLQVIYHHKYSLISDKNRIRITPILPRRGKIITSDGKVIASSINRYKLLMSYCSLKDYKHDMEFIKENISLTEKDIERIESSRKRKKAFIVIKDDLLWDEYAKIAVNAYHLNHISIEKSYIREYAEPEIFGHITGYATRNKDSLQSIIGQTGLESYYNDLLYGSLGNKQVEVNASGKVMRTLDFVHPENGQDLHISINSELQKFV